MNAEFLENNLVIRFKTMLDGQQMYTADKVRKNLAPISFIGAIAVTEDGTQAYRITKANMVIRSTSTSVVVQAGPYTLTYKPASGKFLSTPLD